MTGARACCLAAAFLLVTVHGRPSLLPSASLSWLSSSSMTRRASLSALVTTATTTATMTTHRPWIVTLPLEPCGGGAVCLRLKVESDSSKADEDAYFLNVYRVIIDTGSPYLVIPSNDPSDENNSGIASSWLERLLGKLLIDGSSSSSIPFTPLLLLEDSGYAPTEEIYGSQLGSILWKRAQVTLRGEPRLTVSTRSNTKATTSNNNDAVQTAVLGVMDDALTKESGGALLGLVKHSNLKSTRFQRRPSFLEQTRITNSGNNNNNNNGDTSSATVDVSSFTLDTPNLALTLSNRPLVPSNARGIMSLVDLRRYGDFVDHYAVQVRNFIINGKSVALDSAIGNRDIVAVFDSGLTGCLFMAPLWDELVRTKVIALNDGAGADTRSNNNNIRSVEVQIPTVQQRRTKISARNDDPALFVMKSDSLSSRYFYVAPIALDWFDDNDEARNGPSPLVVVLGQAFLEQGALTVNIEDRRALFVAASDRL